MQLFSEGYFDRKGNEIIGNLKKCTMKSFFLTYTFARYNESERLKENEMGNACSK
jgi:hypothetical protein